MMSLRRLFVRSCNIGGECVNVVVATFGPKDETCSCSEHLKQALQDLGLPTVVLDWVHVDQDLFDAAAIANQVDAAIATSETWSIEESEAGRLPHVLAEVLALQPREDWPAAVPGIFSPQAGPKPANRLWSQLVPSDSSDQRTYAPVPISKETHRLPIELLRKVVGLVESERAKAFLGDVLWCATTEKGFAGDWLLDGLCWRSIYVALAPPYAA